jgi:hypothetical protein
VPLFVTTETSRTGLPFPDALLDAQLEFAFGADLTLLPHAWTWTNLTDRLLADPITIQRGRSAGAAEAQAQSGTVTLINEDGQLTPKRPGAYAISRSVPGRLRVYPHVSDVADGFDRPPAGDITWGYAPTGTPWAWAATPPYTTSTDFALNGTQGIHRIQAASGYRISHLQMSAPEVEMYATATLSAMPAGGAANIGFVSRIGAGYVDYYQLRARVVASTGLVWAQILRRVANVDTLIAEVITGITYTPGVPLHMAARAGDGELGFKVWAGAEAEPPGWMVAATDTTITAVGLGHGVRSGVTDTTIVMPDVAWDNVAIVPYSTRLAGFADDWQPSFLPGSGGYTWSQVKVRISGVSRRLQRGQGPAYSPIRAAAEQYRAAGQPLIGYWPLEDGSDAARGASAVDQSFPMQRGSLPVGWAGCTPPPPVPSTRRWGTAPIADLSAGGRLTGTVRRGTSSPTEWAVRMLADLFAPGFGADIPIFEIRFVTGSWARWLVTYRADGVLLVEFFTADGTKTGDLTTGSSAGLGQYQVDAIQSGANVDVRLWKGGSATSGFVTTTVAGTLGRIGQITVNPISVVNSAASNDLGKVWGAGHVQVWDTRNIPIGSDSSTDPLSGVTATVWQAWAGEPAHRRIQRLCAEAGVPVAITSLTDAGVGTPMGAQSDAPLMDLIKDCSETDGGIRYEKGFALAYLPRGARYNLTPAMTIDLATYAVEGGQQGDVLRPVWDDEGLTNDATVTRPAGSEGRYEDTAHIGLNGRYTNSRQANVQADAQTVLHASWDVHLGTVDEVRYPELPVDLAANPGLIDDWLAADIGCRIDRTNAPGIATPGVISQVLDGYSETLAPRTWSVKANCSPYSPWRVAELDSDIRLATDGSSLSSGMTVGTMTARVANTGAYWTTDPADFPMTLRIGDELVVATSAALPVSGVQTISLSARGVGGTTAVLHLALTPVDVAEPAYLPL